MKEIVLSNSKQLSVVKKHLGDMPTRAILTQALFEELAFGFKVRENLSDKDVIDIVNRIIKDYWHLKLEDIKACFYNARGGRYEQNYNKLEIQVVMRWIEQYDQERQEEIFSIRQQMASQDKINDLSVFPEQYLNVLKETLKNIVEKPIPRPKREYNKDEQAILRYNHAKELFNNILKEQNSEDGLIDHKGKRISFNEYLLTI